MPETPMKRARRERASVAFTRPVDHLNLEYFDLGSNRAASSDGRHSGRRRRGPSPRQSLRLALTLATLTLEACGGFDAAAPRPKRIILFSMDTVRADFVSGYGGVDATPQLAKIAAEGTRF